MTKLLLLYENDTTTFYLMRDWFQRFSVKYSLGYKYRNTYEVSRDELSEADVIIGIRLREVLSLSIVKRTKKAGKFIVGFYDDDFLELTKDYWKGVSGSIYTLFRIMRHCDCLLNTNKALNRKHSNICGGIRHVETELIVEEAEIVDRQSDAHAASTAKVKCVLGTTHYYLSTYYHLIAPIIPKLCDEMEDKITFTIIGVEPDLGDYASRLSYRHFPLMPLDEYRALMEQERFDIGLMALEHSEFGKHKYYNKFIEYSLSGVCGVYSDVEPYNLIVEDGVNGVLVKDHDLLAAIKRVVDDRALRFRIIENAQNQLRTQFSVDTVFGKLVEDIPELCSYHAGKPLGFYGLRMYQVERQIIENCKRYIIKMLSVPSLIKKHGFIRFIKKLEGKVKKYFA